MLVKRKKKAKPSLPKREIRCYHCGSHVLVDDLPGDPHPPYRCPSCHGNWPPSVQEEAERVIAGVQAAQAAGLRVSASKKEAKRRESVNEPQVWGSKKKVTKKRLKELRQHERAREKEIDSILKMDLRDEPRGRKSEPAYDRALYRQEVAQLFGRTISVPELTKAVLLNDKSQQKVEKLRQALQRRKAAQRSKK